MQMSIANVTTAQSNQVYSTYNKKDTEQKTSDTKENVSKEAAVYEKAQEQNASKAPYSINKMSAEDRKALVSQLKEEQAAREQSLVNLVQNMLTGQAKTSTFALGNDEDAMWKFLASGEYTVDEATKKQAQEDISEDGYWGVKQTSQRLFDFASALAGDDVDKMKKMQAAMEKGYALATKAWGGELPDISKQTLEASNKLFDEYYKSKEVQA